MAEYIQGDRSLKDNLGVLDKVYGFQISYIALQSELCNMQQAYGESAKAFYQRMAPIIIQIKEKHAGHLKEEELANTTKDSFYNSLREKYKPLITHKVDKLDIRVSNLLQEVRKIEENEARRQTKYPPSVSARNSNNKNSNNNNNYKGQTDGTGYKSHHYKDKKPDAIGIRMVNDNEMAVAENDVKLPEDNYSIWNDGYCYCLKQQTDEVDHCMGTCYNSRKPGHHWREGPWPLNHNCKKLRIGMELMCRG